MSIKKDILEALKKLKSQVYYDKSNTNLHLRKQLVLYLRQSGKEKLADSVYNLIKDEKKLDSYLKKISYVVIPKKIKPFHDSKEFITNFKPDTATEVEDINLIIDAPLEIHILSILWLMMIGYKIDAKLPDNCYGNRLLLTEDKNGIVTGRGMLKPYYRQYQKWRDTGIKITRFHLEQGNNVAFVNLDISSYYYNVMLNWEDLSEFHENSDSYLYLDDMLFRVHQRFTKKVLEEVPGKSNVGRYSDNKVILPIGLFSSYTLANYYLRTFDEDVRKRVKPLYYGRYVDDIVIVLSNPKSSEIDDLDQFADFVHRYKHDKKLLEAVATSKLTEQSYKKLEKDGLPENILSDLKSLKNQQFKDENNFVEAIEKVIGPEQTVKYKSAILKSTEAAKPLPGNIRFVVQNLSELFRVIDVENSCPNNDQKIDGKFQFQRDAYKLLQIQPRKVMIYEFITGYSQSVIDKLQKDIKVRSSEFRQLPTEKLLDFDKEVYELLYDDSFGKPRTLKDYKENRVGLSTYLYKATSLAIWGNSKRIKCEIKKVLAFFRGSNLIDYYQLWERLFTLLVVSGMKQDIATLLNRIVNEIKAVQLIKYEYLKSALQDTLLDYLCTSLSQAFALKGEILNDSWFKKRSINIFNEKPEWYSELSDSTLSIRNTWFIRSHYVTYPLLEFTKWAQSKDVESMNSLVEPVLDWENLTKSTYALTKEPNPYPRFISLFEISYYLWIYNILLIKESDEIQSDTFLHSFVEEVLKQYESLNEIQDGDDELRQALQFFPEQQNNGGVSNYLQEIHINNILPESFEIKNSDHGDQICIGIANMKVNWEHEAQYSLRGRPLVNSNRLNRIHNLLEKLRTESPKSDLTIFPEISIPCAYVENLLWFAKNYQFGMVFGIEHLNTGNHAYNFIATVLPFKLSKRQDAIFIPRLKNHYSHGELASIRGNHLDPVENNNPFYHLFKWRGLYFTTFYCFELADIKHRSWFRSKVDLLVASEYNRDVNYFSNIIDSTARDLSVYVAQVNSSDFGDNRLTRPAKTEQKNLIRLDGGENTLIITGTINLKEFREHLEVGYDIQRDTKVYKPSPPSFDPEMVKRRIHGKWILKNED